jgi:hypothetical protein
MRDLLRHLPALRADRRRHHRDLREAVLEFMKELVRQSPERKEAVMTK